MLTTPTIHITRDRFHLAWDPAIPPIETVASGAVVEFDLLDASGGQLTASSTVADLTASLTSAVVDQVNGPIAVDGAEPGDTLQVDLLEFEPADWGWTASIPGFGLLADDFPDPVLRITRVPPGAGSEPSSCRASASRSCRSAASSASRRKRAALDDPAGPPRRKHGHPPPDRRRDAVPAGLPRGARFSIGDGHAAQGDGEVCGTAIETPMRALVRLTVRKDLHLAAPEFMTAAGPAAELPVGRRYATDGIGPDLLGAARDAVPPDDRLARARARPIAAVDAYMLCSVAIDLRISEIVDMPNFVVTAHCPLAIFD